MTCLQTCTNMNQLHNACERGDLEEVTSLVSKKECDINALNTDGESPLHIACEYGHLKIVKVLLKNQKCNLNTQNMNGNTLLHLACYKKLLHIIRVLLERRCRTNIPNKQGLLAQCIHLNEDGDCLLHIACRWGDVDIVKYLITDERCNPSVQSSTSENTPLHIAAKYGQNSAIFQLLLCKQCSPNVQNKDGDTPLHIAARRNKTVAISELFAHQHCNPNVQNNVGDTPLHSIIKSDVPLHNALVKNRQKKIATIFQLLAHEQCDQKIKNRDGDTPLHIAVKNTTPMISKLLANEQCNPNVQNKDGDTPLHIAVLDSITPLISHLLSNKKCNPNVQNKDGNTPLHIAVNLDNVTPVMSQLLSNKKCNPNVQNKDGNTPLHIAVLDYMQLYMKSAISQLLTNKQCNPSVQNDEGDTPLHIACCRKLFGIIKLLLQNKSSTNIPNKKGETAQDIPLTKDGDGLLHIACQWYDVDIIKYLITDERCSPNVQNSASGNTPLHIAAKYGQNDTIAELLSYKECDPNAQNKEGDTPLHFAVRHSKSAAIFQLLAHLQCNPNVQNKESDTPLHIACWRKSLDIIKVLLEGKCGTNIPNKKGETAQNIPLNEDGDCLLHIACKWGEVGIVRYLITDERCNPNVQSSTSENTPLHIAVKYGQDVIIVQLLSYDDCNPNAQNKEGDTPLHIAVGENIMSQLLANEQCSPNVQDKEGDTPLRIAVRENIISQLLTSEQCNPNILNKDGDTPLHIAIWKNRTAVILQLLANEQCNPNLQDMKDDTPLHIAVRENVTSAISQLLICKQCSPNILNNDHLTPLLTAIKYNNLNAATAVLQHHKCDPTLRDPHGNTPLHLACISGETQPNMVELAKQLLSSVNVDPSCVNNAGQTPIELTTNYQLIQAISHMVQCKTKQSVQTYINMFIVGNPETGKSTLVKAICKEATSILWKIAPKWLRRVKNVPLHTAGIIPTTFRSKTFGNTVLHDLAGQVEYYTSHAAVIRSTVISTPPAFIVVVNLSESEEKISQTLRYWWSFIDNHAEQSSALPQVILVGSHADVVKPTGESVQEKIIQMSALLKKLSASFHFAGRVALDCRDPASRQLQLLCSLVNQSCTALRQTADVDLRCHVLYAFLLDKFKGKVACMVSDVAASIKETSALLPQKLDSLISLISTLSDKGLLLLVKGGESHEGWWVILQKQALLSEMNGVIFAPKSFRQHKDLSWSTGVVPFLKLKNEFPDYNPIMVSGFLTHLEFCFKIEDYVTLALLKDEATNVDDTSPDVLEEYYFFPALVSVENPLHMWEQNEDMCIKCGWLYQCIRPDQFLTTQFLHVLILRLGFIFALQLDPGDCRKDSLFLRRKCSVWKHGIGWLNWVPIETVVEVGLQHQSVIVMMRCPKGKETECVQLCSQVIQKVLEVKDEHCKAVKMSESFTHPTDVNYPFTHDNTENVKCYSLTGIARMIARRAVNVLDQRGRNPVPVQDLLLFDPYSTDTSTETSPELLRELFSEKHSIDEAVRSQALVTLNSESEK